MNDIDDRLGFAAAGEAPLAYMQRIRDYYLALGYDNSYRWAQYRDVPFAPLAKPLHEARVAIVTTAAPYRPNSGDQGPGAPYNASAKFYRVYSMPSVESADLRISHVAIDRHHTTAEDIGTYFPMAPLREAERSGQIGAVASRFHGLPTNRSQITTIEQDCPDLLARLREDDVDAAVLVPNCPVCHQSVALAAHHLEQHGIATVVMGCAKDIVEHCGVPRFLFSDFPLGNAAGRPNDAPSQRITLSLTLSLLESAPAARTTVQSPLRWADDDGAWKRDYSNAARLSPKELAAKRAEFDNNKKVAKDRRDQTAAGQSA